MQRLAVRATRESTLSAIKGFLERSSTSEPRTAPVWLSAPDSVRERIVCRTLLFAALALFGIYFALFCFVQRWGSDFQLYCAAVARLQEDLLHPTHEAVTAPGTESFAYSPYLVLVGALGKLAGATPYRTLQVAGSANMFLFAVGATYFVSRHSLHRRWELSLVCFLFVTLFLRWQQYGWSSETSLVALQYNQAYPSTIAWALAFFAFGLLDQALVRGRYGALGVLSLILTVLMLTHALTASWTLGIVGLYALVTSLQGKAPAPLLRVLVCLALATGLALLWPYSPLLGQSSLLSFREGAPFGRRPITESLNLYILGFVCAAYLVLRLRKHGFWVLGCLVTLAMLRVWRLLGVSYGNRYAYFAAFFVQFLVAEVMALGVLSLWRPLTELSPARRFPKLDQPLSLGVLLGALLGWIPSPMMKKVGKEFRWPVAAADAPSAHDAYYARIPALERYISASDIVLLGTSHLAFDIASITGAHFVTAPYMVRVLDQGARENDARVFFDPATSADKRDEIAARRGATKVLLLLRWQLELLAKFEAQYGRPLYKDGEYALFALDTGSTG